MMHFIHDGYVCYVLCFTIYFLIIYNGLGRNHGRVGGIGNPPLYYNAVTDVAAIHAPGTEGAIQGKQ